MLHLIHNKRIAIVGPSKSIMDQTLGKYIDSFDLVVRLNSTWPVSNALYSHLGSRTDILYSNGNESNYRKKNKIQNIKNNLDENPLECLMYDKSMINNSIIRHCNQNKYCHYDYKPFWDKLNTKLKCLCNTGTVAIYSLLLYEIKELFICGITFMQEPYYEQYPIWGSKSHIWKESTPNFINGHCIKPQYEWFIKQFKNDKRINVDPCFKSIIKQTHPAVYSQIENRNEIPSISDRLTELQSIYTIEKKLSLRYK